MTLISARFAQALPALNPAKSASKPAGINLSGADQVSFSGKSYKDTLKAAGITGMGIVPLKDKSNPYVTTYRVQFDTKQYLASVVDIHRAIAQKNLNSTMVLNPEHKRTASNAHTWSCDVIVPNFKTLKKALKQEVVLKPEEGRTYVKYTLTSDGNIYPDAKVPSMGRYVLQALQQDMKVGSNQYGFYNYKREVDENGKETSTWLRNQNPINYAQILSTNHSSGVDRGNLSDRIGYKVESDFMLKEEDAESIQQLRGSHSSYGILGFNSVKNEDTGKWISTWSRSGSCD